jgi:hypothetical protein
VPELQIDSTVKRGGGFPFKYLGILVSSNKLFTADLMYVGLKVEKRLPAW